VFTEFPHYYLGDDNEIDLQELDCVYSSGSKYGGPLTKDCSATSGSFELYVNVPERFPYTSLNEIAVALTKGRRYRWRSPGGSSASAGVAPERTARGRYRVPAKTYSRHAGLDWYPEACDPVDPLSFHSGTVGPQKALAYRH